MGSKYVCWRKVIVYEIDYLCRKFRLFQACIFLVFWIILVVMSLSDTQSFFIGEDSPIPNSWKFFKDTDIARWISVLIISLSYFIPWLTDFIISKKESTELITSVEKILVPAVETELKQLRTKFYRTKQIKLEKEVRISIFIPVRQGFLKWSLQMVCKTPNIRDKELEAQFKFDEGVIGYAFLKNQKNCVEVINISNRDNLPPSYKPLTSENCTLIEDGIKSVLVTSAFQEGSIGGLLAIDTSSDQNIFKMEKRELHDEALDWMIAKNKVIRLLWRMKNNV